MWIWEGQIQPVIPFERRWNVIPPRQGEESGAVQLKHGGIDFKSINLGLAKVSIQGKQVVRKYIPYLLLYEF